MSNIPGTTRDAVDIAYRHGKDDFLLIDTAGIRARGKHSSSVEVFSVMRSERTIRRADLCVLVIDASSGVTSQDKKIAALMQKAHKPSLILVNKWDLVKPERRAKEALAALIAETRERLFFLPFAPVLVASALTGENVDRLFSAIRKIRHAAHERIGTGVLNRLLRDAFAANPPPMSANKRLKLFYATQPRGEEERALTTPEFVLFVNDPQLLGETYARYLEAQIREVRSFEGLPLMLNFRPRTENFGERTRLACRSRRLAANSLGGNQPASGSALFESCVRRALEPSSDRRVADRSTRVACAPRIQTRTHFFWRALSVIAARTR